MELREQIAALEFLFEHGRTPTQLEIDRTIKSLGYIKPQGEPPLLSDDDKMSLSLDFTLTHNVGKLIDDTAKAQRAADIKYYEGIK